MQNQKETRGIYNTTTQGEEDEYRFLCENNHFILTAYIDRRNELRLEKSQTFDDANFIDESEMKLNKGFNILSSNQFHNSIVSQKPKPEKEEQNTPISSKRRGR